MTSKTKITSSILLSAILLGLTLTFINIPTASAFPTSAVATVFPNANGVGGHGVAVDSNGIVWYVPVGNGLIGQDPSFAPGDPAGILFRATPFNAVNNAIDNQDNIWISNSNGFVTKYDPVADSFTNFGPVVGCSFLDHIHFHSDGLVYTTCLDGNHIFQIDPVGGGITTFLVPTANSATAGITGDVIGDLWTIERSADNVVRGVLANMVPNTSNGVTEFPIPNFHSPETVKACGDKVWFSGLTSGPNGPRVNNIDINTNVITLVDVDPGVGTGTYGLAIDGNGNPFSTNPNLPRVYGIDTSAGNAVTVFATPSNVHHIAISPNGDLWYTDFSARVTQLVLDEPLPGTCDPTEPKIEKTLIEGPEEIGIYSQTPTRYVYEISYSGPAALVKDTVPAEFEVLSLVASDGAADFFKPGKGAKSQSSTKIEWLVPAGTNTLTVTIETVESKSQGKVDGQRVTVFKPTSCGPLPINDGATAFEVDEDGNLVLDPDTGQPIPLTEPSNSLEAVAIAGSKPCCESDAECNDSNVCTADVCEPDRLGCVNTPIPACIP